MRNSFFILVLLSIFAFSFTPKNEWSLFKSIDGVEIYTKTETVLVGKYNRNMLIFKYINTTNKQIELTWKLEQYYAGVCRGCNLPSPNEYEMTLILGPKETKTGKSNSESKIFAIYKSAPEEGLTPLENFEFANLKVTISQ